MVKIYFKDNKKKFVDMSIWSLVKANILSSIIMVAIFYGIFFALGVIFLLFA